jgi:hypothetical protein
LTPLRLLLIFATLVSLCGPAAGQRMQLGTTPPATSPYTGTPYTGAPATTTAPPPTYAPPTANPYSPSPPLGGSYTGSTYTGSTYTGGVTGAPIAGSYGATAPSTTTAPWDPYAPKATTTILPAPPVLPYSTTPAPSAIGAPPPAIFTPNPGYLSNTPPPQQGAYGGYIQPDGRITQPQRLRQRILFEGTWLAGSGGSELGVTDLELNATFFFPLFGGRMPLFITPGFAVHYWNGPDSDSFTSVPPPELPPRTYDAYLDAAIKPVINNWLSADLGARVGLYTDFESVESDAIRVIARGIGIISISPTTQIVLGVVYLDRLTIKLLPAFGLIWMPNPDARFDIVFPQPKLAYRMTTVGMTEWWWYVAGELGGGTWHFQRADGQADAFEYNDIRAILGLEWKNQAMPGVTGYFEVGYAFNREVEYIGVNPGFDPDDTVMLRAGVTF